MTRRGVSISRPGFFRAGRLWLPACPTGGAVPTFPRPSGWLRLEEKSQTSQDRVNPERCAGCSRRGRKIVGEYIRAARCIPNRCPSPNLAAPQCTAASERWSSAGRFRAGTAARHPAGRRSASSAQSRARSAAVVNTPALPATPPSAARVGSWTVPRNRRPSTTSVGQWVSFQSGQIAGVGHFQRAGIRRATDLQRFPVRR